MESIHKLNPIGNGVSLASYGDDSGLYVEFYMREVEDAKASAKEGRPIFVSKPYIKILSIGNKNSAIDRPVRSVPSGQIPADEVRFPRQWAAFKNQEAQVTEGTPITEWPAINRAEAMSLKSMNIHTIEKLAGLPDSSLTWTGARARKEQAKAWLARATDGAVVMQQQKTIEDLKNQIEALKNQMNGFSKAVKPPENNNEPNISTTDATGG